MLSTRTDCTIAFGGPPKRFWLVEKLITAPGAAPARSSLELIRRPAAGDTARPRKYSPVTYSALALVACPRTDRLRLCPLKYPKSVEKTGFSSRSVSNAPYGNIPLTKAPLSPGQKRPCNPCMTHSLLPSWGGRLCQFRTTSDSGSATGSERNRIDSMRLKIAVLAPMPSASNKTARALNALLAVMVRQQGMGHTR